MGENVPKRSFDSISRDWVLLAAVASVVPVYLIVSHFGDDDRALVASCSAGMIVLVVRYFWDLKNRVWFWIVITFITFFHVLLVLFLPPPAKHWNYVHWNYVQMGPFALLDFAIAYGVIRLVESVIRKSSEPQTTDRNPAPRSRFGIPSKEEEEGMRCNEQKGDSR